MHGQQAERQRAYVERQLAAAAARGFRDCESLPWWAVPLAHRCWRNPEGEIRRLPRHLQALCMEAIRPFTTERQRFARASVAAIGVVLAWLSYRHPKKPGRPSNVGGLSSQTLTLLTRNSHGQPYSVSALENRDSWGGVLERVSQFAHPRQESADGAQMPCVTFDIGPRGGVPGVASLGQCGFLEHLRQAGLLRSWLPHPAQVPDWMKGAGYAFAVFRAAEAPLTPLEACTGLKPDGACLF